MITAKRTIIVRSVCILTMGIICAFMYFSLRYVIINEWNNLGYWLLGIFITSCCLIGAILGYMDKVPKKENKING